MSYHVFIPTRGRTHNVPKLLKAWSNHEDAQLHFVTEPDELKLYHDAIYKQLPDISWTVHSLPIENAGVGFSRNHCVSLAASFGYKSIIISDDDIAPIGKPSANMDWLAEDAEDPGVVGMTARYGYHDLALGDWIRGRSDVVLMPTGLFKMAGLNVNNVLALGNYDVNLPIGEDQDLMLRSIKAGYPWMIHLGTKTSAFGPRLAPGGVSDFVDDDLLEVQGKCHEIMHRKYPTITNAHDPIACGERQACLKIRWSKAYDEFMPEWKKYSAKHGGDLNYYFEDLPE